MIVEKNNGLKQEQKQAHRCSECGGCLVPNEDERYVCSLCGLEDEERITDNFLSPLETRNRERGSEGVLSQHSRGDRLGTTFRMERACTPHNWRTFWRLNTIQADTTKYANDKKKRKEDKEEENLFLLEDTFRRIGLPEGTKKELFGLFGKLAKDLGFPSAKTPMYFGALVVWYAETRGIDNITVYTVVRNLSAMKSEKKIKGATAQLICSKVAQILKQTELITIKKLAADLLAFFCKITDEAIKENGDRIARQGQAHENNASFKKAKIDALMKEIVFKIKPSATTLHQLATVTGLRHIYNVATVATVDEAKAHLVACVREVEEKFSRKNERLKRALGSCRRQIDGWAKQSSLEADQSVDDKVKRLIALLLQHEKITDRQEAILANTCSAFLDAINSRELAGRSRHGIAATIVWMALLYHGVKMPYPSVTRLFNVSESTILNVGKNVARMLGVTRSDRQGDYGYLEVASEKSILEDLGMSILFTDTHDSIVKRALEELILFLNPRVKAEYCASRLLLLKILLGNKKLARRECWREVEQYIPTVPNRRHIRDYSNEFCSDVQMLPISYLNGKPEGMTILKSTDEARPPEKEGHSRPIVDYVLYVPSSVVRYIKEIFEPFNTFVQQCIIGRWNSSKCETARRFLIGKLDLTFEDLDHIRLPGKILWG